jgi:hypothetical protein
MAGKFLVCVAAVLVAACGQQTNEESAALPNEDLATSAAEAAGLPPPDLATSAADAIGMPAPAQAVPPTFQAPDAETRRAALDKSIRGIWRKTPYRIDGINYVSENARPVGENGGQYDATVSVKLSFPSGWNAECIGLGVAYGCRFLDANMMQIKPIPVGESRIYTASGNHGRAGSNG